MKQRQVKDLMVEVSACGSVNEDDTLLQAIKTLSDVASNPPGSRYPMQTILVKDAQDRVAGELTLGKVLTGLEPGYQNLGDLSRISFSGLTPEALTVLRDMYGLWQRPLSELCKKAARVKISGIFGRPDKRQYIDQSASLDEATHRLITIGEECLLVKDDDRVVGLLRTCDVFSAVAEEAERCEV